MIFLDSATEDCTLNFFEPGEPGRPVRMGMVPVPLEQWLIADTSRTDDLQRKRELFATRHDEVVAALPGSQGASEELHHLVLGAVRHEGLREPSDHTGGAEMHPIERAGRLVQEDFCLHQPRNGAYVLSAASLCSPTRWRLAEKLGRSLDEIHEGVPLYPDRVQRRVNATFRALKPLRPMRRTNWSVLDDAELFQPDSRHDLDPLNDAISPEGQTFGLWLRVEVQTLVRLAENDAVVFSIRVFQTPFASLRLRPPVASRFAEVLRALPPETAQYKGLARARASLADWLTLAAVRVDR